MSSPFGLTLLGGADGRWQRQGRVILDLPAFCGQCDTELFAMHQVAELTAVPQADGQWFVTCHACRQARLAAHAMWFAR